MHGMVSVILGAWVVAIAVLSVQNATAVSVRFLLWRSVPLPVGVILAFAVGVGVLLVAMAKILWQVSGDSADPLPHRSRRP
nr:LapA family protein [Petrachloros mirabilis]